MQDSLFENEKIAARAKAETARNAWINAVERDREFKGGGYKAAADGAGIAWIAAWADVMRIEAESAQIKLQTEARTEALSTLWRDSAAHAWSKVRERVFEELQNIPVSTEAPKEAREVYGALSPEERQELVFEELHNMSASLENIFSLIARGKNDY